MRKPVLIRTLWLLWGVVSLGVLTAFSGWYHPICQVVGSQRVPGLPCLPPTPPPDTGETPDPVSSGGTSKQGPVRLTIHNESELPFSMTLTGASVYVLNVPSGEQRVFVVDRGAYSFNRMLCGVQAQGTMDLSRMTVLKFKSCGTEKLVQVTMKNMTSESASVSLSGPGDFLFSLLPGESRSFTIPRGDYWATQKHCGTTNEEVFEARSHRTLRLTCP